MSYALDFADEAAEDLDRLLDSLPPECRAGALESVEAEFLRFAESPIKMMVPGRTRPFIHVAARVADRVQYWGATYKFTQDETRVVITHVYRLKF